MIVGAAVAGYQLLAPEPVESRHVPITTKIVFNREIAQIFQKKCFQCHTDGNVAMALTTYKEARPWAVAIKEEILERKMPPWSAAGGYGHFANDMSLTAREISLILSWTDGGAPSGVLLADEDKQPVFVPSLTAWEQGDARRDSSRWRRRPKVAADSPFRVERFEIANGLKQPRWLRALQLNPSRSPRGSLRGHLRDASGRWLGTWTPSNQVSAQPAGSAMPVAGGGKLTVEIGYRGNPEGEFSGAGELGLYFLEKPPAQTADDVRDSQRRQSASRRARSANGFAAKSPSRPRRTRRRCGRRLGPGATLVRGHRHCVRTAPSSRCCG